MSYTCASCKTKLRCVDSRPAEKGTERRHVCKSCGLTLYTREIIYELKPGKAKPG